MGFVYLLAALACAWFVLPLAAKKAQISRLRRRCRATRTIALTYDDGPGVRLTQEVLEALRCGDAAATFFLLGHKVEASREVVDRIRSAGHEIGSHSHRHLHPWIRDPVSVLVDIHRGLRAVRATAQCRLFRAPHGKVTLGTLVQVRVEGCKQSWWTIDSTDTRAHPSSVDEILDRVRAEGGGVVLMHDFDRPDGPEREKFVLDLTRGLLGLAQSEGFRIRRLGEIIG